MKTKVTFEAALEHAENYTGKDPKILVLVKTFSTAGVHLMMADQKI